MRFVTASIIFLMGASAAQASMTPQRPKSYTPPRTPPMVYTVDPGSFEPVARTGHVRERIRDARKAGLITKSEARQLRREADALDRAAARYSRNGLTSDERSELEARGRYLGDAVSTTATHTPGGN